MIRVTKEQVSEDEVANSSAFVGRSRGCERKVDQEAAVKRISNAVDLPHALTACAFRNKPERSKIKRSTDLQ